MERLSEQSPVMRCTGVMLPRDDGAVEVSPTGRYIRFNEEVGRGAFKIVYKAFDEVNGIEVAWNKVKVDDVLQSPIEIERLYTEVYLLKTLKHEKIIKYYTSWIDDEKKIVNIITELFTSGSLRQYQRKHKKVDMKAVKGWARQILIGLDFLHNLELPVIHRDLKCDNIFINGNHGEVKIGDLGLATVMHEAHSQSIFGTPEFMAPELYLEKYNQLVDIYSFGMCVLEMVTFEYPYSECKNSAQIYRKVTTEIKPAALSKVEDPLVRAFIEKCIGPATGRLPARELLKDPFFMIGKTSELQVQSSISSADMAIPEERPTEDRCILPEQLISTIQKLPISMDIDANLNNRPVITVMKNSEDGNSHRLKLIVEKTVLDYEFMLEGYRNGENSVSLKLCITIGNGQSGYIHFDFFLDSDTALSVASEMVEQLELANQYVKLVSELVDSLLINLICGWKPCISIDRLVILDGKEKDALMDEPNGLMSGVSEPRSDTSFQNVSESADVLSHVGVRLLDVSVQPTHEANATKVDTIAAEDPVSDISLASAMSACNIDCKEYTLQEKIGCEGMAGELPDFTSTLSAAVDNDDGYWLEVERIELEYQQALDELNRKKQQAIYEARLRAAQKQQRGPH